MKVFHTPPEEGGGQEFYTRYAPLIPPLKKAGILGQFLSAFTEFGILYAMINSTLTAFLQEENATRASIVGAIIGVLFIEVGLRKLLPYSVKAFIHKRWKAYDLPMSITVLMGTVLLFVCSIYLSFSSSRTMIKAIAPEYNKEMPTLTDSTSAVKINRINELADQQVFELRSSYDKRIAAVNRGANANIKRIQERINSYKSKETPEKKYTTLIARLNSEKEDLAAKREDDVSKLAIEQEEKVSLVNEARQKDVADVSYKQKQEEGNISKANNIGLESHNAKYDSYGSGLAWFTVVCALILLTSIIVDELHKAGASMKEQVEPSAYSFQEGVAKAGVTAVTNWVLYWMYWAVHFVERKTPDALPPVESQTIFVKDQEFNVKTIQPSKREVPKRAAARRTIGFNNAMSSDPETDEGLTHSVNASSCLNCGKEYKKRTSWQKYCSTDCKLEYHAKNNGGTRFNPNYKTNK